MATIYRIQFNNVEEQQVQALITDESGDLDVIDIDSAEDAVRIVSQDNDESKFSPIKAKKVVLKFFNSQSVNLRTFATGEDNKWTVEVKINNLRVFFGLLEQGDIEEPFQYQQNQIVTLTATDGLGTLKTHRLEDIFNVWTPDRTNENRIIDYIAACLGATGLRLPINVINNLREEDNDDITDPTTFANIYAALFLNIKTWEDGKPGKYLNCYDILERILGHDCFLTQAKGEWWIIRVKELRPDFNEFVTVFDFDGTALSFVTRNYEKAIGLKDVNNTPFAGTPDASAYFSQDKTIITIQRPLKYVTLRYNYENPLEILCNGIFERGDFIADLPDELDADGFTLTAKSYAIDCWDYEKNVPPTTQDSDAYIKRLFQNGQEKQRFVHLPATAGTGFYYLLSAEQIPVNLYDRFTLSFTTRYSNDLGGGSGHFEVTQAWVRLYADDGTFWNLHAVNGNDSADPSSYWVQSNASWTTNQKFLTLSGRSEQVDFTQWINLSYEAPPIPRSGKLEILLVNAFTPNSQDKDFGAVNFEYIPYINGNYDTFASQSDTSTRDGFYLSSLEEDVYISNSPNPIFKGALLKPGDSGFIGVGRFYEGQEFDQTTGPDHLGTYGQLRVVAFHNQYRNGDEIYRLVAQGIGAGEVDGDGRDDHQELIHRIFNRDIEPDTNTQAFQLVNQDLDLRNCEWSGTMIRNFDTGIGFITDDYDFEYETPDDLGETTDHGNIPGEEPVPTPGDDIEAATELVGETWSVTGNNGLATEQAIDNSFKTLWYKWFAPLDGRININTSGSNFNTTIRVGTWDGVTFTELGYNDDAIGTTSNLSSVDIEVTQGVEYYFAIGSSTVDDSGDYVFNMDLDGAGPNASSGGGDGGCLKFVNVSNKAAIGVTYVDCDGVVHYGVTIASGESFCAITIENIGTCGNIIFGGNCETCDDPCCQPIILSVTVTNE